MSERDATTATLLDHWRPLIEWVEGRSVGQAARDLLAGIQPENPGSRRELLVLALLAVSVDVERLRDEFGARAFLDAGAVPADRLVERQQYLTRATIGTAGPLNTLGRLVYERSTLAERARMEPSEEPYWNPDWRQETAIIWGAAVRFGHLAQTISQALDYRATDRIRFYRSLLLRGHDPSNALVNDVSCVAEPWADGTLSRIRYVESHVHPHSIFELHTAPAGIVAVAHYAPDRATTAHPSKFLTESGHPIVAAYPPLAHATAHYQGPAGLVGWRHINVGAVRNH
jgi:hypothetical protein